MRTLGLGAVTVLQTLRRCATHAAARLPALLLVGVALASTACSGKSGHAPGACEAENQPPLTPTPLDFVSRFPFGSQARSLTGIQNAFDLSAPRFNALLTNARAHDPCAGGTVLIAIAVRPDGSVAATQVIYDDTHPSSLGPQVEHEVQGMNFGAVAGGGFYTFQFPIRFNGAAAASSAAKSAAAAAGSSATPAPAASAAKPATAPAPSAAKAPTAR